MSSGTDPERSPFIIEVVERTNRALRDDVARTAEEIGHPEIRSAHNAVFGYLRGGPMRVSELAARAGVTKQSMGELVRVLIGSGLLEVMPDPSDRRAKLLWYTPAGLDAAAAGFAHLQEVETDLRRALGDERIDTMLETLTAVAQHLGQEPADPAPAHR